MTSPTRTLRPPVLPSRSDLDHVQNRLDRDWSWSTFKLWNPATRLFRNAVKVRHLVAEAKSAPTSQMRQ